jgi:hypothetical protein
MVWKCVHRWFKSSSRSAHRAPFREGRLLLEGLEDRLTPAIHITLQPLSQTVVIDSQVTFKSAATGNPTPTVQWQVSTNKGMTWTDIAGATSDRLKVTAPSRPGVEEFRAVFTNKDGSADSRAAVLRVDVPPMVTRNPAEQTVLVGGTATFHAAATGTPDPRVHWQVSTDHGKTFTDIPGATSTTLSVKARADENGDEYRAVFTNAVGLVRTSAALLRVGSAPSITREPTSQTVATNSKITLTADARGVPNPTVQWQVSHDGGKTWVDVKGATSEKLEVTAPSRPGVEKFRAVFSNSFGKAITRAAVITVDVPPVVTHNPPPMKIVHAGTIVTFDATARGTPDPRTQWQVSTDHGKTFTDIPGATSDILSFTAKLSDNGDEYRAVFKNPVGIARSSAVLLTVLKQVGV